MYERFTQHARQVAVLAAEEAKSFRHHAVGTDHLLLGLIREEEGLAARVLESLGVELLRARALVLQFVGTGEDVVGGIPPLNREARKAFDLAYREVVSMGVDYVGTEHLLLGLIRSPDSLAYRILLEFGTDAEKVRNEVIRWLAVGGVVTSPQAALELKAKLQNNVREIERILQQVPLSEQLTPEDLRIMRLHLRQFSKKAKKSGLL